MVELNIHILQYTYSQYIYTNYLLRTFKYQRASVFNPSISILGLMILTAILMPKQVSQLMATKMKCRNGWVGRGRERESESNLTPSCLSLAPIGAYPYMWKATLGALYTSWLFRAIVLITLLMVAVALRNFIWGYHSVSVTLVQTLNLLSGGNILSCVFGLDFIRLRLSFIVWVQLGLVFMGYYLYLYFLEAL